MTSPAMHLLAPFGVLYGAVARSRQALYSAGILTTHRLEAPVISVGNITAGGTGKTPLVAWLARTIARGEGARVCILTRGYARAQPHRRVVVSDGVRLLADADAGGDEPRLLAEMLQGEAAVISDAHRVEAARWALRHLRSEIFILDDGFQHLRLARDLDIVALDGTDPWGGGRLLPHGLLREPLRGLGRADCVVITRADKAPHLDRLREKVRSLSGGRVPILNSYVRTVRLRPLLPARRDGKHAGDEVDGRRPCAAFCALGNPQAFFMHLRGDGYDLTYARAFPDHHTYRQGDIDAVVREARARGARALLTTAKDAVKLQGLSFSLPCHIVDIETSFDDEEALRTLIRKAILPVRNSSQTAG